MCVRICRHVIGFTMDKFRLESVCSIDNVQSMLIELKDEESSELPLIITGRDAQVPELGLRQPGGSILARGDRFTHCDLVSTPEPANCWKLISVTKLKPMTSLLSNIDSADPETEFRAVLVDPFPLAGYHKMEREVQTFPSSPTFKKGQGPGVALAGLALGTDGEIQGYDYDDEAFENEEDDEGVGGASTDLRLPQTL